MISFNSFIQSRRIIVMKEKPRDKKVTSESEALADDIGKRMRKGEKEGRHVRPNKVGRVVSRPK